VALASGYARGLASGQDPRQSARDCLARVWGEVSSWGSLGAMQQNLARMLWGGLAPSVTNPLDINPLRALIEREVDFEAVARQRHLKVFVSATHVNTGRAVIFTGSDLTLQAVMASACLPMVFRPVTIAGESYWDGGYSVNPPLSPLIDGCGSRDILLVQINPLRREKVPDSMPDIVDRINELTFNASLLTQMRSIDFINRLIEEGALRGGRCKHVLLHRVDGGAAIAGYAASTRQSTDPALISSLFDLGQHSAREWLGRHFEALGQRGTVNVRRDYLDDTEDVLPGQPRGFRPWLARLFRRRDSANQKTPV